MVTPCYYPVKGGTEAIVWNLQAELNRIGIQTDVMTFNMSHKWKPKWKGETEQINGGTVFRIPALNWLPIEHSARINMEINLIPGRFTNILKHYDIIHFHELDFSFPLFSFFVKKPKLFHLHGINVDFHKNYRIPMNILRNIADYYISISRKMERDLMELGIPRNKIAYLPNSVDTQVFSPVGEKEENLLLFIGRISFIKGLHVLLESLRYIQRPVRLIIVGPIAESPQYYEDMLRLIAKENRRGRHRLEYLGALEQKEVAELCKKASIVILPSLSEAFPVVVLEALACETPIVATPVGGIPEIVQNQKNGLLIPPNNSLKLAEAIEYLLSNKSARISMGKEGRKNVIENFSLQVVARKLCDFYRFVVTQKTEAPNTN